MQAIVTVQTKQGAGLRFVCVVARHCWPGSEWAAPSALRYSRWARNTCATGILMRGEGGDGLVSLLRMAERYQVLQSEQKISWDDAQEN